jgi:hypothetical protein
MASLHEQLLKAGLIDKDKAADAEREQRKKAHQQTAKAKKKGAEIDETKLLAEQARQAQIERSKELNRKQREQAEHKAIQAQIKQLISLNKIDRSKGQFAYQFVDHNKVKSIYVTETLQDQLAYGVIALVKFGEGYELVPKQIAEKIMQRDVACILVLNTGSTDANTVAEDDPYADFKIPDDLMW